MKMQILTPFLDIRAFIKSISSETAGDSSSIGELKKSGENVKSEISRQTILISRDRLNSQYFLITEIRSK